MTLPPSNSRSRQRGSAFIMLLALIAILLVISTANQGSIRSLRSELRALDRAQQRHWQQVSPATNSPSALAPPPLPGTPHD